MANTPFESGYQSLRPVGKFVLIEVTQEQPSSEKKVGSLIVPGQKKEALPTFALVRKVGDKVELALKEDDFIEVNTGQLYPNIVDADGFGRYMLVHEEQIAGVYSKE